MVDGWMGGWVDGWVDGGVTYIYGNPLSYGWVFENIAKVQRVVSESEKSLTIHGSP